MTIARPDWGVNHVLAYGQSLSSGWEGFPALSVWARHDTVMLGDSVRPRDEHAAHWVPVGEPEFRALRATVQDQTTGALVAAADVARAPRGAILLGETILEGALNSWRARVREDAGGLLDPDRQWLASSCGVGGQSLEQLSRGANPELFNRLRDCVGLARAMAQSRGRSYGVVAVILMQGEANNWGLNGATAERMAYAALMRQLYADIIADVAYTIAGQDAPPALFTYQTGGAYASESNSVPQAQLETALSAPGCFLVAPVYPVTEKGGHLDANGYRWMGAQFGKVMHRVISRGQPWQPLHPVGGRREGDAAVVIAFHVPHPPLAWGRPFIGHVAADVQDRGFALFDERGEVAIAEIALADAASVRIVSARSLGANLRVQYASAMRSGRGCLHDSDPAVADDCYEYAPDRGHLLEADIPELVGRPYPLVNWCVAFTMHIE